MQHQTTTTFNLCEADVKQAIADFIKQRFNVEALPDHVRIIVHNSQPGDRPFEGYTPGRAEISVEVPRLDAC